MSKKDFYIKTNLNEDQLSIDDLMKSISENMCGEVKVTRILKTNGKRVGESTGYVFTIEDEEDDKQNKG